MILQTINITGCLPFCHGQVVHEIVAAGGGSGAGYLAREITHKGESLQHQIAYLLAGINASDNKIIAGETSHRSPIDDVLFPHFMIAEICRHKVLDGVESGTIDGGLVIGGCHAYVVGGDT